MDAAIEARPSSSGSRRRGAARARLGGSAPLRVFCAGIGGTGLSGLARLLVAMGHLVEGSDRAESATLAELRALGIEVSLGQQAGNLDPGLDLFVATAALPQDHPELCAARAMGIPTLKYAEALAEVVNARAGVAIAGTHGKTTTTALTAFLLERCGSQPSWLVGGDPRDLPAAARLGAGPALVFEACEYDRSFRHYAPAVTALLNVEADHLDCYADLDEIVAAFADFGAQLRRGGALVVNADCPATLRVAAAVRALRPDLAIDRYTLGEGPLPELGRGHGYRARDLQLEGGCARLRLERDGEDLGEVRLTIPGRHNAANALAAIACAARAGAPVAMAARAVTGFGGVRRRFEVLAEGDVVVVDDYAHHPTAIEAVIDAARRRYPDRRVVVAFEPHQASRTRHFFGDFARALAGACRVLLADIYLCRDGAEDAASVSSAALAAAVRERAPATCARHAGDLRALGLAARGLLQPGDVALFLGAGRISGVAHEVARAAAAEQAAPSAALRRSPAKGAPAREAPAAGGDLARIVRRELGALLEEEAPLGPHCTLRAGGVARFLVAPRDLERAIAAQRLLLRLGVPVIPLGGGSNTLFCPERLDAAVLLTTHLRGAEVHGTRLRAACGATLMGAIRLAEREGLAGLERFAAIPGTIGGAVFGNAGGARHEGTVGDLVTRARVVEPDGRVRWRGREELGLRYRGSELAGCLVLEVELELRPADPAELRRARQAAQQRKATAQPLSARSAGCTFRNPAGGSAGRLIDELGLKGLRRGGAMVSTHHANFIVNDGGATPQDVLSLIEEVRARVRAASGVELETELRLVA